MLTPVALIALAFSGFYAWTSLADICFQLESHEARWSRLAALVLFFAGSFAGVLRAIALLLRLWI